MKYFISLVAALTSGKKGRGQTAGAKLAEILRARRMSRLENAAKSETAEGCLPLLTETEAETVLPTGSSI